MTNEGMHPVYTIGHSTHSIEAFIGFLQRHEITVLADVRSRPYSRYSPQFDREALIRALPLHGIRYGFLGRELGGRPDDAACYENGRVCYARVAETEPFRRGIERILRAARCARVALMCTEKEPLDCHRTLLVARALAARGIVVRHILEDGRLEEHGAAMDRLLDLTGVPRADLFHTREELIDEAIRRQEGRVAYVDTRRAGAAR